MDNNEHLKTLYELVEALSDCVALIEENRGRIHGCSKGSRNDKIVQRAKALIAAAEPAIRQLGA